MWYMCMYAIAEEIHTNDSWWRDRQNLSPGRIIQLHVHVCTNVVSLDINLCCSCLLVKMVLLVFYWSTLLLMDPLPPWVPCSSLI